MAIIKNLQVTNAGEGVEKREPSHTVGGNVIGATTMENSTEILQKTKNRVAIWSCNPILGIYPDKTIIQKDS